MESRIKELSSIFDILSNEVRLCILLNLYRNSKKNVGGLQSCAKVSQSVVSQQLAKLKAQGIITSSKVGNEVFYSIQDRRVIDIFNKLKIEENEND
jgi:ArsR family transcriptional regulator